MCIAYLIGAACDRHEPGLNSYGSYKVFDFVTNLPLGMCDPNQPYGDVRSSMMGTCPCLYLVWSA